MPVLNPPIHPQLLFLGFEEDDIGLERMRRLAGHSLLLSDEDQLSDLRVADWDALIVRAARVPYQASGLHVLAFASPNMGQPAGVWAQVVPTGRQPSRTLSVAEESPAEIRRLLSAETLPWIGEQEAVPYLQLRWVSTGPGPSRPSDIGLDETQDWIAFVRDADQNVVVGAFPIEEGRKWCWTVPHVSTNPELWLSAAMDAWRESDPDLFPDVAPWREREQWLTPAERATRQELEELRANYRRAEEEFRSEELKKTASLLSASRAADGGARRLLTTQGDELVDSVRDALAELGFLVEDIDAVRSAEGLPRVEDLHVSSPSHDGVAIIAEVKGYARGGAKTGDLVQIGQHALRYAQRQGQVPDRTWYIVNHFAAGDPDTRPQPLAGAAEDVAVFAQGGGLIVDTRELFKVHQMVLAGSITSDVARDSLLTQQGVYLAPALPVGE